MGAAIIQLTDPEPPSISEADPSLTENGASQSGSKWTRNGVFTFAPRAKDPGLGVRRIRLSYTNVYGQTVTQERNAYCTGTKTSPCEDDLKLPYQGQSVFTLNAASSAIPEGQIPVTIRAADALGSGSDQNGRQHETTITRTIKVDRTGPNGTIAGVSEGEALRDRDYPITATSADTLSGSRTVQITLDGAEKARRDDCAASSSPCTLDWTFDGGDPSLTEGDHVLRVVATDQAGNTRTAATRTVRVDRTPPTIDIEGSLKPEGSDWVAEGEQDLLFDALDEGGTGVVAAELKIDGQTVEAAPTQTCEQGGCELSHDFYVTTDGYLPGEHDVTLEVTDGAGNKTTAANTPAAGWTISLERDDPLVVLSGSLWDARLQPLQTGETYSLTVEASEPTPVIDQSGAGALEFAVDGDAIEIYEQGCEPGACSMTRSFDYSADDFGEGEHEIAVTATDFAGNEQVQTFTVNNPSPPAPVCGPPPPNRPSDGLLPLAPNVAAEEFRLALPVAFEESSGVDLLDLQIKPEIDATLGAVGSVADTKFGITTEGAATRTTETSEGPSCLTASGTASDASDPILVDETTLVDGLGTGVLYANSQPATDTLLRPSATGSFAVSQIRSPLAPTSLSWEVDLQPGQQLDVLDDGTAAVIEPAEEGTTAPSEIEDLPSPPTVAERKAALSDTDSQVGFASDALERAQGDNPDRVVALVPPPWAEDSLGNPVATSLSVSGSTITMQISHAIGDAYPVVAAQELITRDAVDEYETLWAGAHIGDYAFEERSEPEPAPTAVGIDGPPPPAGEDEPPAYAPDDTGGLDASEDDPLIVQEEDAVLPQASSSSKRVPPGASTIKVGISAFSAATITNPNYDTAPGALNPPFVRPFAPWNFVARDRRYVANNENDSVLGCGAFKHKAWKRFGATAKNRGIRVDLAINADSRVGRGGTKNFTLRKYRKQVVRLLDERYGHLPDGDDAGPEPDRQGIVDNLMAWNEPNYEGSGRVPDAECPGGGGGANKGNPLRRDPIRAARLWVQAMHACFPDRQRGVPPPGTPPPAPDELARCGHYGPNGKWGPGEVVAGEFVGRSNRSTLSLRGRRQSYVAHYFDEIERLAKKLKPSTYRRRVPHVWSFHNYGDFKNFLLHGARSARPPTLMSRFVKLYRSERYEYLDGTTRRKPKIWATESGGVNYTFNCESIPKPSNKTRKQTKRVFNRFCSDGDSETSDDEENIALLGMPKQASALAFALKEYGRRSDKIQRVYYFQMITKGECGPTRRGPFTCPLSEFGLLGSDDDDLYRGAVGRADKTRVIPFPERRPPEPNDHFYSKPGERRYSFCLLRDRNDRWLRRAARINRDNCAR